VKECPSAAAIARKDEHFQRAFFRKFDCFSRPERDFPHFQKNHNKISELAKTGLAS